MYFSHPLLCSELFEGLCFISEMDRADREDLERATEQGEGWGSCPMKGRRQVGLKPRG